MKLPTWPKWNPQTLGQKLGKFFKVNIGCDKLMAPINEQLVFVESQPLTLGVELELAIVDATTLLPLPIAGEILGEVNGTNIHQEAAAHVIEFTTGVCQSVQDAHQDLSLSLNSVQDALRARGAALCGTGSVTLMMNDEIQLNQGGRYDILNERRQLLYRNFNSMQGMHIHIGMKDADACMRHHNFFIHLLPHILALSASTIISNCEDTGLASYRASIAEALPIAGRPYQFSSWQDYQHLCLAMERAESIVSLKDINVDLRPCPRFGTLEIRIADQPATLRESMAIVAFVHSLAEWFEEQYSWDEMHRPSEWRIRDNKWRAMRYGLDADIIVTNQGDTRAIAEDIELWLERLAPITRRRGYEADMAVLRDMITHGNSAARQRALLQSGGRIQDLAMFNLREWQGDAPLWHELQVPALQAPDRAA